MELWDNVKHNNNDAVLPDLGVKIKELFKREVFEEFNRLKRQNTWGPMTILMVANLAKTFGVPAYTLPYASTYYMKKYPDTFKKTGELYRKMKSESQYQAQAFGGGDEAGLTISIPFKTENFPSGKRHWVHKTSGLTYDTAYVYRWLEEKRSFTKGIFLKIWPKIFDLIRSEIGK